MRPLTVLAFAACLVLATAPAVSEAASQEPAAGAKPASPAAAPVAKASQPDEENEGQLVLAEPDFSVVNLPTTLRLPRHQLSFRLTHRFLANLRQNSFSDNLDDLFGLDNGAIIGFEFRFAPIRRLQTVVYRNNLSKTFQFSAQYDAVRQGGRRPVSLSPIVSIEGTNNFKSSSPAAGEHDPGGSEGYRSPAVGAVVSRTFGTRLAVYATPMWVHDTLVANSGHRDTFFVGLAARARIGAKVYLVGEVSPRVSGYAPGQPEFAFGIERRAGGHMFLLTFTNSLASTFGQTARGGFPDTIYMGFNMSRKFF